MERQPLGSIRWPMPALIGLTLLVIVFTIAGAVFAFGGALDFLPESVVPAVQLAVLAAQYAVPVGLVALLGRIRGASFKEATLLRRFKLAEGIGLGIGVAIVARFLNGVYSIVITLLGLTPPDSLDVTQLFPDTLGGGTVVVLLAVFIAPLAEEIMFRGVLYPGLRDRFNPYAAGIVSAVIFTLFHGEPFVFLPILALGLMLAWLTETTRSIWPAIVAHAAFNASAVVMLYTLRLLLEIVPV